MKRPPSKPTKGAKGENGVERAQATRAPLPTDKVPLFPKLTFEQVKALRVGLIVGDGDEVDELEDGIIEPIATELDLYNKYGSTQKNDLHAEVQALSLDETLKPIVLDQRDVHLGPYPQAPTRRGPVTAPDVLSTQGPRTKRDKGVAVLGREQLAVPQDVTAKDARQFNLDHTMAGMLEQQQRSSNRVIEHMMQSLFNGLGRGLEQMIGSGKFNDVINTLREELAAKKTEIAELKAENASDRLDATKKRAEQEEAALKARQDYTRDLLKKDNEIAELKDKIKEQKRDYEEKEGMVRSALMSFAGENAPSMIKQLAEKLGFKIGG